ncbi:DUF4843 domain-containing protein [Dysgonomonas sp.]
MKTNKINAALLICLLATLMSSCAYDSLPVYEDVDRVYFLWARINPTQSTTASSDKVEVNLGYDNPVKSDSTISISVSLMGRVSDKDRPVNAELIKTESSAVQGQDIEFLPSFIPAGQETGKLRVRINNTKKLESTVLMARIRLIPNEYFHVDFTEVGFLQKEKSALEYNIYFDAIAEAPNLWRGETGVMLNQYFGSYSNAKFQLICDVLGITRDFFMYDPETESAMDVLNARIPSELSYGMIAQINRYLDQYEKEHGKKPTDENGVEIKMGTGIK